MLKYILLFLLSVLTLFGASETKFPSHWKEFSVVDTPFSTVVGNIPSCDVDVSDMPPIYQETVAIYCSATSKGAGDVEILVNDMAKRSYAKRDGSYPNGSVMILHLKSLKTLFVTSYKNNKPYYGIYTEKGKDISSTVGSGFNPHDCRTCHTGYGAFCLNGQCGTLKKDD